MSAEAVFAVDGVTKTYHLKQGIFGEVKPLHALSDISFDMRAGEVVGLVGESGCGKSTLAKILLGLLPATSGSVAFAGQPLDSISPRQRASMLQPVFQDPYSSLNPRKTVAQIVSLPLALTGVGRKERVERTHQMLELVGLPPRTTDSYPSQLSGGQRQRVAIARALISQPRVLVCDEPTSALDVSVQSQILNLLNSLREQLNLTYLLISHDLSVIRHMTDRVLVMYLGRIVEESTTEALFQNARHPYTQALLRAELPLIPGRGLPDMRLRGEFPNPIDPPSGCAFHPRCPHSHDRDDCSSIRPELTTTSVGRVACHLEEAKS